MAMIKFYLAGDHTSLFRKNDLLSGRINATRFYCSIDDLFINHRNKNTTIVLIDSDVFKQHYKYNRKTGFYEVKDRYMPDHKINSIKTILLEH